LEPLKRPDSPIRRAFEIDGDLCGIAERPAKLARTERDHLHGFRNLVEHGSDLANGRTGHVMID
jgi:hypothetical protein